VHFTAAADRMCPGHHFTDAERAFNQRLGSIADVNIFPVAGISAADFFFLHHVFDLRLHLRRDPYCLISLYLP